ncbi:alginate O-acetylation protein [Haloferula helveola]|uniref:Alginate O-acetylation protein n=1 Tax=Haloferula helveola TaxID=490095 RepID=A0ABM7RIY9_9BACT|nr:alginate O-acetylation protein [Haloferula helveola]
MLFNSYTFLLLFLPITLVGFLLLRKASYRAAVVWLVLASLTYYAYWIPVPGEDWSPKWLLLILGSCVFNFLVGRGLSRRTATDSNGRKALLAIGVGANLAVLGVFKYAGLFAKTAAFLADTGIPVPQLILPLGISFFTFQQIAYLIDAARGETSEYHFTDYLLFVSFFPQLIAGPIVHHREMMPQFQRGSGVGWARHFPVGFGIFAIGLFKKVVVADPCAQIANPLFELAASDGRALTMAEAWTAGISYSLQIYFDFSGYSDMAIGAARLFGIRLPLNFHSPYKARTIIEFWRCWHMTLSRFLRDYLYIPLGGNRKGPARRYLNLFATMLLGGLWHGAGWTYVLWGGLHGAYLCVNHFWNHLRRTRGWRSLPAPAATAITFIAVVVAWIPFRAGNFELDPAGTTRDALQASGSILSSMFGLNGFEGWPDKASRVVASRDPLLILIPLLACWLLPNTQQIFRRYRPTTDPLPRATRRWWQWRPTPMFAIATVALLIAVGMNFDKVSEFIYFQF